MIVSVLLLLCRHHLQVHPAPGPEEVNWQHLWMSYTERDCRSVLTWPLLLVVVLFPITLITSAASRLEYVFCPQVEPGQPTVRLEAFAGELAGAVWGASHTAGPEAAAGPAALRIQETIAWVAQGCCD